MPDFVTLSCPSCGGKLNVTDDIQRFACGHCGREHVVTRAGGIVSLLPVVEALRRVEVGVDKAASELAINRLQREIDELRSRRSALVASSPKPQVSVVLPFVIGTGILLVVAALVVNSDYSRPVLGSVIVCGGTILVMVGMILFSLHSSATRHWQVTTGTQLSEIESEIAQRQSDIDGHRRVLA
jgi:hypothetical protein